MEMDEKRLEALDLNRQASLLMESGKYEEAKALIDKAVEADPMCMDSYQNTGLYNMAKENYEEAKNGFKKALLIDKQNGEAYYNLGNAHFMLDELSEGIDNYNRAIAYGFNTAQMQYFLGIAYDQKGEAQMALRHFAKAVSQDPSNPDYKIKKTLSQMGLNLWDDALNTAEDMILSSPEQFEGYHLKTQILLHNNNLQEAVGFAEQASARFPADTGLFFDWVKVVALLGNYDKAFTLVGQAKQMEYFEEARRDFTVLEAELYAQKGDFEKAIALTCEVIENEAEGYPDFEARHMVMNLYFVCQRYQEAYEAANAIVAMDQGDEFYRASLYYAARSLMLMGRKDEAKKAYKEALGIYRLVNIENPSAIDAYLFRAMSFKDVDEDDKALEMIEFILNLTNELAEPYVIRAEIYKKQGREEEAKQELEKAYVIKPDLKGVYQS